MSNEILFILYSVFGWGIPLLAIVLTSVAQFRSTYFEVPSTINPNMGLVRCWFSGKFFPLIVIRL